MAVNITQLFGSDFGTVDAAQSGGVYLKSPGIYVLRIVKIKVDEARAGFPYFLAEFDIVESSHPELVVGTRASWMATMKNQTFKDTFRANVKGFVLAALQGSQPQVRSENINDQVIAAVTGEQQPLTGVLVRAQATNIETKAGNPFTKVMFQPYQQQAA